MDKIKLIIKAKKIALFGWPASGKSTFSKFLEQKLMLPVFHMDLLRCKNEFERFSDEEFLEKYNAVIALDKWIIEGNALSIIQSRLDKADVLIYFNSDLNTSIQNFSNRIKKEELGSKRIGFNVVGKENVETFYDWLKEKYVKKIDKLMPLLKKYEDKLIIIENYSHIDSIMEQINNRLK